MSDPKYSDESVFVHHTGLCIFFTKQETQRKLQTLTKESCYFLSKSESVRSLAVQIGILEEKYSDTIITV